MRSVRSNSLLSDIEQEEDNYVKLITPQHKSLACKALLEKPALYERYSKLRTPSNFTLNNCIKGGIVVPEFRVGFVASEAAAYETYRDLTDEIICGHHSVSTSTMHRGNMSFENISLSEKQKVLFDRYIISSRIRVGRNLQGYPFPPCVSALQRRELEVLVSDALMSLSGAFKGTWNSLKSLTDADASELIERGQLFLKPDKEESNGIARSWPDGRGIFYNYDKSFFVWVNEEDGIRCISMQQGGDLKEVALKLREGTAALESALLLANKRFAYCSRLGYINTCPTNIGTGLRASVMIKLPKLFKKLGTDGIKQLCISLQLQVRGSRGETSKEPGKMYEFDISNKVRFGTSELEQIQQVIDSVTELISLEEAA